MKKLFLLFILIACAALAASGAFAQERTGKLSMADFNRIPVLHDGRLKPMESFAALALQKTAGQGSGIDASLWLAQALFNPHYAASQPAFLIADPALAAQISAPPRESHLYSLGEIAPFLAKTQDRALAIAALDGKSLPREDRALAALHESALFYGQILNAVTGFLPMDVALPESLPVAADTYKDMPTWEEVRQKETTLMGKVKAILDRKGEDPARYTEEEKKIVALAAEFQILRQSGARNVLLRILPPQWEKDAGEWLSPWMLAQRGAGSPQSAALLAAWKDMARAFRAGDAESWQTASRTAYETAVLQSGDAGLDARLRAETLYNALAPFTLAAIFYGLAGAGAILFLWRPRPLFYKASLIAASAGMAANLGGVMLRIFILQRPPVGSLYESLLFVALVVLGAALASERRRGDALALSGGALSAALILFIAPAIAPDGDDLQMLVAVLNTNFWLATHVVCITAGYGLCIMTAGLAHIYMFRKGSPREDTQDGLLRSLYITSLWALLLTATGTILGGIWADQSWGRFWGWDPKENGALLIVLWLIWAHHGRLSGHLKPLLFAASLAFMNVIVALAWFGVNLLGVGLHSYGFISGIAAGLAAFCLAETAAVTALLYRAGRKGKAKGGETA